MIVAEHGGRKRTFLRNTSQCTTPARCLTMLASRARDGTYVSHGADGTSVVTTTYPDVAPCRVDERDGPRTAEAAVHLALGIEAGFRGDPAWRVHSARRAVYDELGDARDAAHAHAPNVRLGGHGARAPVPRFGSRRSLP